MRGSDPKDSRKHPISPRSYWRAPFKRRTERPDRRNVLVPFALLGFMATVALILIFEVIATGPDTHATLWNKVHTGYSRTDVTYVVTGATSAPEPTPGQSGELSFTHEVLPIFQAKCVTCHGLGISAKGISLASYEGLMDTEAHEPLVVPGKPDESLIVNALRGKVTQMPPTGSLPEEQIQTIEEWIRQGAKDN